MQPIHIANPLNCIRSYNTNRESYDFENYDINDAVYLYDFDNYDINDAVF